MIKKIMVSAITMILLDSVYLTMNYQAFAEEIAAIQRVVLQLRMEGAILCYFFLIFGLYYFILRRNRSVLEAFLFGLVIYAVYDTTNYATLKKWSPYLAIMDTLWGGTLFALTTYITYWIV